MDEQQRAPQIEGAKVSMGGKDWVIPALSLGQVKRLQGKLAALGKKGGTELLQATDDVVEVVHAALSRNYPNIKPEDVSDMLDLRNMGPAVQAVMGQSGLVEKGETTAGSQ